MKHEKIRKRISVVLAVVIAAMGVLPHMVFGNNISAAVQPQEPNGAYEFMQYLEPKTFDGSSGADSILNSRAADLQTDKLTKVVKSTLSEGKADSYYSKGQAFYIYYTNNITDYTVFDNFKYMGANGCFDIWVKTPKAMSFTVKLRKQDDIHAIYNITSTSSTDWQALRIPVADMTYSSGYTSQNAFDALTAVSITPAQSTNGFLAEGESIYWGGIDLYKSVMPDNGQYELKYTLEPKTFDGSNGSVSTEKVNAPERFTKEVKATLNTGKATSYYSADRAFYLYYENNVTDYTVFDKLSAMGNNGYFSIWLKTPHAMSFTLKLRNRDDIHASVKINTAAYNGWQEIKIPASILTYEDGWNLSNAFNELTGISITPDRDGSGDLFLKEGESFTVGSIGVYQMMKKPDKRFQIEPYRPDWTKENNRMTGAIGDVTNAPDGSSDFGRWYSLTVGENFYTSDYSGNILYMLVNWGGNLDFSTLANDDSYLRLWVKTPHSATFTVKIWNNAYVNVAAATVTTAGDTQDWQAINIPVADLNITAGTDLTKIVGVTFSPAASAEEFLAVGETFTYGAIDLFATGGSELGGGSGDSGDDTPVQTPDKRFQIEPYRPDWTKQNNRMTGAIGDVTNAPDGSSDFGRWYSLTVGENFYTSDYSGNILYMLVNWGGNLDFSTLANDDSYLRLWVKTPHSATFTVKIWNNAYVNVAAATVTTAGDTQDWQAINIPVADLNITAGTDLTKIVGVTFSPAASAEEFLTVGETFTYGAIDLFATGGSELGGGSGEGGGDTPAQTPDKRHQINPWRDDATKANGVMTAVAFENVTNAPDGSGDFGKYYSFTVGENFYTVDYSSANRIYMLLGAGWAANLDFSVLKEEDSYLRLWVKTPHAATFTITLLDGSYVAKGSATVTSKDGTTDWQAIDIPVSKLNLAADLDLTKVLAIKLSPAASAEEFLAVGETFTYGAIDLFATGGSELGGGSGEGGGDTPAQTPDKRHQINPWRDNPTKADGVMTAVMGDVTSAPDGSNNFGKYYTFTVGENFYTLDYSSNNLIYMLLGAGWAANLDFSVLKEEDSYLRLWVKTPHAATFTITLLDGSYVAKGSATVTSKDGTTDWQAIDIPVSKLNLAADLDLTKVLAIKLSPAGKAKYFLNTGETFTYGAFDLFKTGGSEIDWPEEPEGPTEFQASSFLDNQPKMYSQNGVYSELDDVDFTKAIYWKVTSDAFYSALTDYNRCIYVLGPKSWTAPNYDFSLLKTEGYMRLYYKTEKPATFKISFLDTSYQEQGSFNVTTAEGTDWQYVDVNVTDMTLNEDFDFSKVFAVKMYATDSAEKFVDVGKQIVFGSMYLYKGDKDPSEGDGGEDEMPDYVDLGELTLKPNHSVLFDASQVKNSACSASGVKVKEVNANTSLFAKSMRVTLNSSESYFANVGNITFYTDYQANINLWDGLENGYFDLWIKTPHSITMQLVLNKTWPNAFVQFSTENGTDWQRVRIPMSKFTDGTAGMSYNNFVSLQLRPLTAGNFLLDGESFEVGRITFVCPNSDIGSSGADKTYPISENELTEYTGSNYKITTSTYQHWSGDPDTVKNEYNNIARDDENYFRFTSTQTIWLEDERIDDYYNAGAPIAAMIYLKKDTDENGRVHNINLDPYILTGTIRFYVKAPKKMTFNITMRNGTANSDKSVAVPITVEPTEENGGFTEVQIPIKKFYDAAVEQNIPFRFDLVDQLGIKAITATREGFLDSGEKLIYSQVEIWTKEAVEPTVPDKTKIFLCSNNDGITVIDKNEIMPETTVISAFRNKAEANILKSALLKWSNDATYFDALCIRTVSDNSADARLSNPYEPIKLKISTDYLYTQGGVTEKNISQIRAVVYDDGSYKNVSLSYSDGYVLIDTQAMGDYIFYIGTPGKDIEKQYIKDDVNNNTDGNDDGNTLTDNTDEEENENESTSSKKVIKKVIKKKKPSSEQSSNWWIWTIVCAGAAVIILGGGFLGYKKFFKKTLCLLLIAGLALCSLPIVSFAEDTDIKFAELRLAADHPGAPGYDAEYEAIVYYGSEGDTDRLQPEDYTLYCDYGGVKIDGSKVTLTSSFRENAEFDGFKLYVKINSDKNAVAYYPIMIKKWQMTVEDNFDGDSLDTAKWTNFPANYTQLPQDGGKFGQQSYCSADCATVENGSLVLRVLNGRDGVAYSGGEVIDADFLMPRVTSKFSQQYGCFSADIKFPYNTTAPSNSGFWLLPTTGNWGTSFLVESKSELSGYCCGEIDIIEYSPAWLNGKFQSAMHWWNNSNFAKYSGKGTEVSGKYQKLTTGQYVNMSCVWTANSVYVYADGILMRNTKNVEATGELAYVLFTIQTAGYGEEGTGHWLGGSFTEADVPNMVMYVDSFKAFK